MSGHVTVGQALELANGTHVLASLLRRSRGPVGWWRERKFTRAVEHFAHVIRSLPQSEVETASETDIHQIGKMVDAIVEDVEQFIASHRSTSLKRVEADRFLVRRIYGLRDSYESISKRVAPRLEMEDLRQRVKADSGSTSGSR